MKGFLKEIVQFTLIALFIILPFRLFIAQPFIVNGESMAPTFDNGDYLIVDQLSYRIGEPKRGSVVIFRYPYDTDKYFIKRIIGLPGENVLIEDGKVTITNAAHPEGFVLNDSYVTLPNDTNLSADLDDDEYFVMGDNRAGSLDSRSWGPLEERYIIGRPVAQLFPITDFTIFPGDYTTNE